MKVSEDAIKQVLEEVAKQIGADSGYMTVEINRLTAAQPNAIKYVVAHNEDLSVDEIGQVLFQVATVQKMIAVATGRSPRVVSFPDLDAAVQTTPDLEALAKVEADVASYIFSNLDMIGEGKPREIAGKVLAHVSRALIDVTG